MKSKLYIVSYSILLSIVVIAISNQLQEQISFNDGKGWDGQHYYAMAEQFSKGEELSAKAPFVYRIAVPWLVSIFNPKNITEGYLLVNWITSILNAVLLSLILLRTTEKKWIIYILVTAYITQWHSYFRFGSFYPMQVDSPALLLILLSLIVMMSKIHLRREVLYVALITTIGTFVREIIIIAPILLLLKHIGFKPFAFNLDFMKSNRQTLGYSKIDRFLLIIPIVIYIIISIAIQSSVTPTNSYKFYNAAVGTLYTKSLVQYLHSWLVAFGPLLLLLILFFKETKKIFGNKSVLANLILLIILFAYFGGADTERIAYWSFPAIYFAIAYVIDKVVGKKYFYLVGVVLVLQIIVQRLFWTIPDYPSNCGQSAIILTPIGNCFPYLNLFPAHSELIPAVIGFAEWSFLLLALWLWKRGIEKKKFN